MRFNKISSKLISQKAADRYITLKLLRSWKLEVLTGRELSIIYPPGMVLSAGIGLPPATGSRLLTPRDHAYRFLIHYWKEIPERWERRISRKLFPILNQCLSGGEVSTGSLYLAATEMEYFIQVSSRYLRACINCILILLCLLVLLSSILF